MEFEDARTGSRQDVATWLRGLADQVESGELSLGDAANAERVPLAEELAFELELEAGEEGRAKLEIEIEWTNTAPEPAAEEPTAAEPADEASGTEAEPTGAEPPGAEPPGAGAEPTPGTTPPA